MTDQIAQKIIEDTLEPICNTRKIDRQLEQVKEINDYFERVKMPTSRRLM